MASLLQGIFPSRTNTEVNSGVTTGNEMSAATISNANKQALLDMISNLSAGDTILGKVLSQSGKNLSIITQDGYTINAKNDTQVNLEKGTPILFEVQKRSGREISLRPLYQNTSIQKTAEVALNQANLPVNSRSLELTGRNMEYGNPIDRHALAESFKDAAMFPEASVRTIVDLQTMGIEVNEKSISNYQAYVNMEDSVAQSFSEISDALIGNLIDEISVSEIPEVVISVSEDGNYILPDLSKELNLSMTDTLLQIAESLETEGIKSDVVISMSEFDELVNDARESGIIADNLINSSLDVSENGFSPISVLKAIIEDINNPVSAKAFPELSDSETSVPNEAFVFDVQASLTDFLSKDSMSNLVKKAFSSQWTVGRDKLDDKTEIKDLYSRLFTQSRNMLDILSQNTDKNQNISDMVQNMRSNLEFLNDLNNYVPYLQIPFHSSETGDGSELYVYTNKRSLTDKDGEVSAFIHLDMESLGPTDVYVKMRDQHVSTKFTVKDEDTLIFLEHHLDMLDRRLKEKGYSFDSSVNTGKAERSPLEQMLYDTQRHLVLQDTSFDARV